MILEKKRIGLQRKIAIIYIFCFIVMVGIGYGILEWTMMNSIKEFEEISVNENLSRVQNSIKENISYLEIIAADWGGWDDTYFFTQNNATILKAIIRTKALLILRFILLQ